MGSEEWDALSWDMRDTYLDGLSEDPEVPFRLTRGGPDAAAAGDGPAVRQAAGGGAEVIDLRAMIADLEAGRLRAQEKR